MNLAPDEKAMLQKLAIDPESGFRPDAYTTLSLPYRYQRVTLHRLLMHELIEGNGNGYRMTPKGKKALAFGKYVPGPGMAKAKAALERRLAQLDKQLQQVQGARNIVKAELTTILRTEWLESEGLAIGDELLITQAFYDNLRSRGWTHAELRTYRVGSLLTLTSATPETKLFSVSNRSGGTAASLEHVRGMRDAYLASLEPNPNG